MAVIKNDYNKMAMPLAIERGNAIPLDSTSVWTSFEEAQEYAASGSTAYVGQVISVIDTESEKVDVYSIQDETGTLKPVGSGVLTSDEDNTIIITNDLVNNDTNISYGRISGNNNTATVYGLEITNVDTVNRKLTLSTTSGLKKEDSVAFWTYNEEDGYDRQRAKILSVETKSVSGNGTAKQYDIVEVDNTDSFSLADTVIKPRVSGQTLSTDIAAGYWLVPYTDKTIGTELTFEHDNTYFAVAMDGASNKGFIWSDVGGMGNKALSLGATAFGYKNKVTGERGFASGYKNTVTGHEAHAQNASNTASGRYSSASGGSTEAKADWSSTSGYKTVADNDTQTAVGFANREQGENEFGERPLFTVGNGWWDTSAENGVVRSDAFNVYHRRAVFEVPLIADDGSGIEKLNANNITEGILLPERGGTGKQTLKESATELLKALPDASATINDETLVITSHVDRNKYDTYHKRPVSALWNWLKTKIATTTSPGLMSEADKVKLDNAMPKSGGDFTGAVSVPTPTSDMHAVTKQYVDNKISGVYKYKGSKNTYEDLPISGKTTGDVWNVICEVTRSGYKYNVVSVHTGDNTITIKGIPENYIFSFEDKYIELFDDKSQYVCTLDINGIISSDANEDIVTYSINDSAGLIKAILNDPTVSVVSNYNYTFNKDIIFKGELGNPFEDNAYVLETYPRGTNFAWSDNRWEALGGSYDFEDIFSTTTFVLDGGSAAGH